MAMRDSTEFQKWAFTSREPAKVTEALRFAQEHYHLISPATDCPELPEGFEIATTFVLIDVERETYDARPREEKEQKDASGRKLAPPPKPGDPRGLSKAALDRISLAAGVSWDPTQTHRLDDESDAYYAQYQAVGTIRQLDATIAVLPIGTRTLDLRPTSFLARKLGATQPNRLAEMRKNINALAETMARLRVLRSLGARTTYTRKELERPFFVARVAFTGRTNDPELRKLFARMRAESVLGPRALYGEAAPAMLAAPVPSSIRQPPPPIGAQDAEEDFDDDGVVYRRRDAEPARRASAKTVGGPRVPASEARTGRAPDRASADRPPPPAQREPAKSSTPQPTGFVIPGGPERDVPIEECSDTVLDYWTDRISLALDRGEGYEGDEELVDALIAEQARRHPTPARRSTSARR